MEKHKLRGFINTLNLEAEKLGLTDIQVSQVPAEQMGFDNNLVETVGKDTAYVTISKKADYPVYPPTEARASFGVETEDDIRLAYERASAFLRGIKFARDIENPKSEAS
jgi:hypothetical protein